MQLVSSRELADEDVRRAALADALADAELVERDGRQYRLVRLPGPELDRSPTRVPVRLHRDRSFAVA